MTMMGISEGNILKKKKVLTVKFITIRHMIILHCNS
jgi:hypothetical protein